MAEPGGTVPARHGRHGVRSVGEARRARHARVRQGGRGHHQPAQGVDLRAGSEAGADARAAIAESFWPALHIDLRMVDTSDFIVCYCPTNVYSVGTPHEIILAREQRKPVLFVSPYVEFPALAELTAHLARDAKGKRLLRSWRRRCRSSRTRTPARASGTCRSSAASTSSTASGLPSTHGVSLGQDFARRPGGAAPAARTRCCPSWPSLNRRLPPKWDRGRRRFAPNDDWILWDLKKRERGAEVAGTRSAGRGTRPKARRAGRRR